MAASAIAFAQAPPASRHPAEAIIERASVQQRTDPEASRKDAESALALLREKPDPDLEVRARLLLCDYLSERDHEAAESEFNAISLLLPKVNRGGLRAGLLTCQGETLETLGENSQALGAYEQAVRVAEEYRDDEMLAGALFSRGYVQSLQGEFASGLADLRRSQGLYETLGLRHHSLTALNGIAILYNRMGDFEQARDIYSRTLASQREAGMLREQSVTLHNLGRAHENLKDWPAARRAFNESFAITRELNYPRGEAYALRGLAAVENGLGNFRGALETLNRASVLQARTPDARLLAQVELARGVALRGLGRTADAATALTKALGIFQTGDARGELAQTYEELAAVEAQRGNLKQAYELSVSAKTLTERLLRNQIDQRFATLKVEFDMAAKDNENALLVRENQAKELALERGRNLRSLQAVVIALIALLVVLLATLLWHHRRTARAMRRLALTDELTGVPNRRAVLAELAALLARPDVHPTSILITDLDHFKGVNDRFGHPAGDEVLKIVSSALREALREPAFYGRLGGEEFLIVLPQTGLAEGRIIAERLRETVAALDLARWVPIGRSMTASIGVTVSTNGDSPSTMLHRADEALYLAKRAGRNTVRAATPGEVSAAPANRSRRDAIHDPWRDELQQPPEPAA